MQWPTNGQKEKQCNGRQTNKKKNNTMAGKRAKRQTIQWPTNGQKNKQWSCKIIHRKLNVW